MKYLLDTCVLIWALEGNTKAIDKFLSVIEDESNYVAVSVVSYWEIMIKKSLGKINFSFNLMDMIEQAGFSMLNLEFRHIDQLEKLPNYHNDPFDRMLISQALADKFQLLTLDTKILQ